MILPHATDFLFLTALGLRAVLEEKWTEFQKTRGERVYARQLVTHA
jgi:hypothetical protein